METELKPCPFCGGEAWVIPQPTYRGNTYQYFATCTICGVEMPRTARTESEAIERWNRRVPERYSITLGGKANG